MKSSKFFLRSLVTAGFLFTTLLPLGAQAGQCCLTAQRLLAVQDRLTAQVLVEEVERTLPGKFGRCFVVAGRGVVVEAVIGALVHLARVDYVIGVERRFKRRPAAGDSRVERRIVE